MATAQKLDEAFAAWNNATTEHEKTRLWPTLEDCCLGITMPSAYWRVLPKTRDDLRQEARLIAWEACKSWRPGSSSLCGWLKFVMARRLQNVVDVFWSQETGTTEAIARNHRKKMKFDPDLGSLVDHHSVTELTDKIEESYCAVDIWSEVDDTLAVSILVDAMGLTSEQRHIIRSRALDTDATFAEIGAEIGINYKRVDNLIYKLRIQRGEELRQIIAA